MLLHVLYEPRACNYIQPTSMWLTSSTRQNKLWLPGWETLHVLLSLICVCLCAQSQHKALETVWWLPRAAQFSAGPAGRRVKSWTESMGNVQRHRRRMKTRAGETKRDFPGRLQLSSCCGKWREGYWWAIRWAAVALASAGQPYLILIEDKHIGCTHCLPHEDGIMTALCPGHTNTRKHIHTA